ncbi:11850_t:CDS:2, partial [Acaulospora colombiana]
STDTVTFNEAHPPQDKAIEAFQQVEPKIKQEIIASRKRWDGHEPRMWSRAAGISDKDLVNFDVSKDLVAVRAGPTTYGVILLGKIRLPAIDDENGKGFIHVRIHDPPNRGTEDVVFHSLFTDEGKRDENGQAERYVAIQTDDLFCEILATGPDSPNSHRDIITDGLAACANIALEFDESLKLWPDFGFDGDFQKPSTFTLVTLSPHQMSRLFGTLRNAGHNVKSKFSSKKDESKLRAQEILMDHGPDAFVDVTIRFIGANGLPKMDVVGSADPFFVANLDDEIKFISSVKSETLTPVWNEKWSVKNVPKHAVLEVEVYDKDEGTPINDYIGK